MGSEASHNGIASPAYKRIVVVSPYMEPREKRVCSTFTHLHKRKKTAAAKVFLFLLILACYAAVKTMEHNNGKSGNLQV